ncbi:HprK-related kinase A [Planctellipticum variicoloris]|uniref:HprK-related kinase A n=1 Tax=Planctellipticum variicoloris TaxID=3064265 RepID=UPI00301336B7|nr:HprK-related kinase A [Planctomycetaceae bacterium SH412]
MVRVIVRDLTSAELTDRLGTTGLAIRTGPFVSRIRSDIPHVARGIADLYSDFPVIDSLFTDFELNVVGPRGIRSWVAPRAYVLLRGQVRPVLPAFEPYKASVFLEWGLNHAIYSQVNSYLILHAAVLERAGRAVVLLGVSGSGKSTLCAALAVSGWRLLTDELALIDLKSTSIIPIARPISLKNESIDVIRQMSANSEFGPRVVTRRKGLVCCMRPPSTSVIQMDQSADPALLVFIRHDSNVDLAIKEVSRAAAFPDLVKSSFNYEKLGAKGFRTLCRVMDRVECRQLVYGDLPAAIKYFEESIDLLRPAGHDFVCRTSLPHYRST